MRCYSASIPSPPITCNTSHLIHLSSTTYPPCHPHEPVTYLLPSTSSLIYLLANQCGQTYPLNLLTSSPHPNGYLFVQIILFFTIFSPFTIQMPLKSSSSSPFLLQPPLICGHCIQCRSLSDFYRY